MPTLQIPVDTELHRQLKISAATKGVKLKDMVIATLAAMLLEDATVKPTHTDYRFTKSYDFHNETYPADGLGDLR